MHRRVATIELVSERRYATIDLKFATYPALKRRAKVMATLRVGVAIATVPNGSHEQSKKAASR